MSPKGTTTETYKFTRHEIRAPMEVGVQISGHSALPGVETTFTENVSPGGARVRSVRRWRPNDKIWIATLTGTFRSLARVAYCQAERGQGYAVGLEFLERNGSWVVGSSNPASSGLR